MHRGRKSMIGAFVFGVSAGSAARSNIKSESGFPHVMNRISSLLQNHAGTDEMLQTLAHITPGAGTSMSQALNTVIADIESNVMEKIKAGHAETQKDLDDALGELKTSTAAAVAQKSAAIKSDTAWFSCVASERELLVAVETADAAATESRSNQDAPCQTQVDLSKFSTHREIAGSSCDFSAEGSCESAMDQLEDAVSKAESSITSELAGAQASYDQATNQCNAAKADALSKQSAHSDSITAYEAKKEACVRKHEQRQLSLCLFGSTLQQKCAENADYNDVLGKINSAGNPFSHSDRVAEWTTSTLTMCMLRKVLDGDTLDAATLTVCTSDVNYARDVGELSKPDDFPACTAEKIKFGNGQAWEIPEGDLPSSSDYNRIEFAPLFAIEEDVVPFDFCSAQNSDDDEPGQDVDQFDLSGVGGSFSMGLRFQTSAAAGTLFSKAFEHGLWKSGGSSQAKMLFIRKGRLCFDIGWRGVICGRTRVSDGEEHEVSLEFDKETNRYSIYLVVGGEKRLETAGMGSIPDPLESVFTIGVGVGHKVQNGVSNGDMAPKFDGKMWDLKRSGEIIRQGQIY